MNLEQVNRDVCIICGGVNDSSTGQAFCSNCAKETWGAGVMAKFIEATVDLHERLATAEATIGELRDRIAELEFEAGR